MQKYSKLLTGSRFRKSEAGYGDLVKNAESDRGRLVYCPAFRRLQQKAQVFSMEPNAAVRSRLTHSLEVAQMGRYIADQIIVKLEEEKIASDSECRAIITFVETACLMHDIGNPPFGHFGEAAISEWFKEFGVGQLKKACGFTRAEEKKYSKEIHGTLADFFEFDGNPQGLRVVLKLQRNSDEYGLNLTKTTIASYLKYIRCSDEEKGTKDEPFLKKCGFFKSEEKLIRGVWDEFGYSAPQRFPLAYIMEAADDLAYCISDLEDSIEKGLVSKKDTFASILASWNELIVNSEEERDLYMNIKKYIDFAAAEKAENNKDFTFIDFRTSVNRVISEYCARQYLANHDAIVNGVYPSLLSDKTIPGKFLDILKSYCKENVYSHGAVQRVELAGYKAIYGLLDIYKCLLSCGYERFECALDNKNKDNKDCKIVVEKKYLSLFPENYKKTYRYELEQLNSTCSVGGVDFLLKEWNIRAHLVVDYISGMTDDFAIKTYRELSGMKL